MKRVKPKISILIPTYNGEHVIRETLLSILSQNFSNFEIIINDDCSSDRTVSVCKLIRDKRIRIYQNSKNLGYPGNLKKAFKYSKADIIFLMGQDDILAVKALEKTIMAFRTCKNIGAVTRPFYSFDDDIYKPVRAWKKIKNPNTDEIITINSDPEILVNAIDTLGQLSGLAIRRKFMNISFHDDIFPCHIYPILDMLKKHSIIFLSSYTVAVRIMSSQSRKVSSIYEKSPLISWLDMMDNIFYEKKYLAIKTYINNNYIMKNYIGLLQIKNYAKSIYLYREIYFMIIYRPLNMLNFNFWFFCFLTILTPRFILRPLVDFYKKYINSLFICNTNFYYLLKMARN